MFRKLSGLLILWVFALNISACSSTEDATDIENLRTAEQLYDDAKQSLTEKKYADAVEDFLEIERQYPFSPLATRAQIEAAFTHYKDQEYQEAVAILDRFIKLHPGNIDIAYAYYLRALCYYDRIVDIKRDQDTTKKAMDALNDVVVRFPQTEYARDAKLKLDLTHDHLAGKEMEIGRFYQNRGQYIAAINRYKTVVDDFGTTSHVPEALYRLTELYLTLGVEEEARKNSAVLGHNFPASKWYKYAYRLVAGGKNTPKPDGKPSWYKKYLENEEGEIKEEVEEGDDGSWFGGMKNFF